MASRPRTSVPTGQPLTAPPGKRRPAAFAADPFILDDALGLEIDDGEIGVVAHGDAAFAGDAEDALRTGAGQIDEAGEAQATCIDVVEHHRHERLHARHARGRRRIALALLLERVRRVIGAEHIDHALFEPPPQPLLMLAIAERRVHLRARAEHSIGLGRGERQMLRRDLDGGDVLVQRKQRHLLAGRDMQHVHALAGRGGEPATAARSRRARRLRRAIRCGSMDRLRAGASCARFSLASSSEWKAARRRMAARMRASVSSSSTRRSPVEEPMKTLTPAAPGRRSSSARSSTLSRVAPTKKAKSQCMRPVARATLSASASALVVGGLVFGISNTAVTPPSTADRLPGLQILLMLEPGLAEMHLAVDHAGQNVQAGSVDGLPGRACADRADLGDAAVPDANIGKPLARVIDDGSAFEHEIEGFGQVRLLLRGLRPLP